MLNYSALLFSVLLFVDYNKSNYCTCDKYNCNCCNDDDCFGVFLVVEKLIAACRLVFTVVGSIVIILAVIIIAEVV